jgi:hypothetical protein
MRTIFVFVVRIAHATQASQYKEKPASAGFCFLAWRAQAVGRLGYAAPTRPTIT